jgi:hypothetical protein
MKKERESGGAESGRAGERGSGRAGERETLTVYLKSQISNLKSEKFKEI